MNARALELVRQDSQAAIGGEQGLLDPLRGARLLVTGGTGFLGTWIAELVAALNDDFGFGIKLSLLARSTDRFALEVPHLATRADFTLLKADVRNTVEVPRDTSFVVHAAATPDNRFHATCPVETMDVVAAGTAAMVRAVERSSAFARMLNVSSALVYGAQPVELERIPESWSGAP
jgi:nucleoside-diphosphate-sugar epimerase